MKKIMILVVTGVLSSCANSQDRDNEFKPQLVGGPCQGCEGVFEYGDKALSAIDTLPDFGKSSPKIKVTGTIYQSDGKTPAKDVILYVYHTNREGIYPKKGDETGWGKRHGYIRGWVKTGDDGRYVVYTFKPGSYPDSTNPAHIHPTILEPNGKYYSLGSYHFEGDPFLTEDELRPVSPRGGSTGILSLQKDGDLWVGKRDITLGKNVPGYN